MLIHNTPFYFLLPQQLLETCRREAAKKSISTASLMREALMTYLAQQDPEPTLSGGDTFKSPATEHPCSPGPCMPK